MKFYARLSHEAHSFINSHLQRLNDRHITLFFRSYIISFYHNQSFSKTLSIPYLVLSNTQRNNQDIISYIIFDGYDVF
ncbi:MSC_0623 family F1-like ATPase-associated protein [Psychrobacter glacincola]|uniref:MSC_0623 family F1-like ATPase-associated protein n=1 Tax=Psychrobacter glacincola TaxID=56810 RepID=UPI001D12DE77